jgi:hypothetical protein
VDVLEAQEMVSKDGGILVASLGETALSLAKEARLCQLEVVDRDALPQFGGGEDRMLGCLLFATPSQRPLSWPQKDNLRTWGGGPEHASWESLH